MAKNSLNLGKQNTTDSRSSVTTKLVKPKEITPSHILIKLSKIKYKEKILKAVREKQQITYKGNPIRLAADLSAEALKARREWQDIFKVMKGKTCNQDYPARISFRFDGEIKNLYRQAKRIQHHQRNITTNAKGTSLSGKHKRRKDLQKQTQNN